MKTEKDYVMEEKLRGKWIQLKGVRIEPSVADELNRDTFSTGVRYVPGVFGGVAEAKEEPKEKDLSDRSIKELIAYAEEQGIDLGKAKKKAEIIAVINNS